MTDHIPRDPSSRHQTPPRHTDPSSNIHSCLGPEDRTQGEPKRMTHEPKTAPVWVGKARGFPYNADKAAARQPPFSRCIRHSSSCPYRFSALKTHPIIPIQG